MPPGQSSDGAGWRALPGGQGEQMVGSPWAAANPGVLRADQRARQCVWPGPCSQLPCHYVPAQPWLTEQKSGPHSAPTGIGVPAGAPSYTSAHMYPHMHPTHSPPGGHSFPEPHHHWGPLPGYIPWSLLPSWPQGMLMHPRGPSQPPREGLCSPRR